MMSMTRSKTNLAAYQIMSRIVAVRTQDRTEWHCDYAIRPVTDHADWLESRVLLEGALDAWGIMQEAMK